MGDGTMARAFHEATKHSSASVRLHRHALDGSNRPFPFKVYEGLEPRAPTTAANSGTTPNSCKDNPCAESA